MWISFVEFDAVDKVVISCALSVLSMLKKANITSIDVAVFK